MMDFGKKNNTTAIADALMKRFGSTMNGPRPGYKPPPTSKLKVKPKKDSLYIGGKITF